MFIYKVLCTGTPSVLKLIKNKENPDEKSGPAYEF